MMLALLLLLNMMMTLTVSGEAGDLKIWWRWMWDFSIVPMAISRERACLLLVVAEKPAIGDFATNESLVMTSRWGGVTDDCWCQSKVAVARLKILMGCDCGEDFNGRRRCISDSWWGKATDDFSSRSSQKMSLMTSQRWAPPEVSSRRRHWWLPMPILGRRPALASINSLFSSQCCQFGPSLIVWKGKERPAPKADCWC